MRGWEIGAAAVAAVLGATAAGAAPDGSAAAMFGARESIEGISLSPDGMKLAYIAPIKGQGAALYVVDLASGESKVATAVDGNPQRLLSCGWAANDRLVCTVFAMVGKGVDLYPVSRLVALDANGGNVRLLSEDETVDSLGAALFGGTVVDWLPGSDGQVLLGREHVPEAQLNTRLARTANGYGVDRVDTRTLNIKPVEQAKQNAVEYISDGHGEVRLMGIQPPSQAGYSSRTITYSYRLKGSRDWKPFGTYDVLSHDGLNPYAVDSDLNVAYVLKKLDGRERLYKVALDGSMREELVLANPMVDIDDVVRIGRSRRVVGASFVTDKRETVYFDPGIAKLTAALSKALPNLPQTLVAGASVDESKLLLWAGSDTDPGRYYLYEKANHSLKELMLARPQLEGAALATVKPISYRAADGTMVPGYLTLPPGKADAKGLPALVMPHGGPEARDEWGFDWLSQYFAHQGFAVLQPNFRGSTGYGDAWFAKNGFQSWRLAVGDVVDAGRWLVSSGVADPKKLAIFGWSYGGYAALQANVIDADLFKAVVAVAPVTDLALLIEGERGFTDLAIQRERVGQGPHVKEGSPAQHAALFKAPVLMFQGDLDRNVSIAQSRLMDAKLASAGKKHELVVYPKLDHYLEDSAARADMLAKSDAFLRSAMGI